MTKQGEMVPIIVAERRLCKSSINLVAMWKMSTMRKIQCHYSLMWLQKCSIYLKVSRRPREGLHIYWKKQGNNIMHRPNKNKPIVESRIFFLLFHYKCFQKKNIINLEGNLTSLHWNQRSKRIQGQITEVKWTGQCSSGHINSSLGRFWALNVNDQMSWPS